MTQTDSLKEMILEVVQIARLAGDEILKVYNDPGSFEVETKSDDSPLTRADQLSNDAIIEGLTKLAVNYPIISEETKQVEYDVRKEYNRFWLVDPLDGTKEFIKRNGEFTVNIALVDGDQPIAGVVYVPVTEEMYWAIKGEGAFYSDGGEPCKLMANSFSMTDEGLRVVCSRSHVNADTQEFIDELKDPKSVSRGSSLKFLIIAKGEADLYPRLGPTMEWDTGAAHIILEEAGGSVLRADSKNPLTYNKESLLNPYFIAYGQVK